MADANVAPGGNQDFYDYQAAFLAGTIQASHFGMRLSEGEYKDPGHGTTKSAATDANCTNCCSDQRQCLSDQRGCRETKDCNETKSAATDPICSNCCSDQRPCNVGPSGQPHCKETKVCDETKSAATDAICTNCCSDRGPCKPSPTEPPACHPHEPPKRHASWYDRV